MSSRASRFTSRRSSLPVPRIGIVSTLTKCSRRGMKRFGRPLLTTLRRMSGRSRSEEHTSELQSQFQLVCRHLLEKKNNTNKDSNTKKLKSFSTYSSFLTNHDSNYNLYNSFTFDNTLDIYVYNNILLSQFQQIRDA